MERCIIFFIWHREIVQNYIKYENMPYLLVLCREACVSSFVATSYCSFVENEKAPKK